MAKSLIDETYLVSEKITRVDPAQLLALERFVGGTLPSGYKEYLRRFGTKGMYVSEMFALSPEEITQSTEDERHTFSEMYVEQKHDYDTECPISDDDLRVFFPFGRTVEGDAIIAVPSFPGEVFIIQRHADPILRIERGFEDPLLLLPGIRKGNFFRYFLPDGEHVGNEVVDLNTAMSLEQVSIEVAKCWEGQEVHHVPWPEPEEEKPFYVFVKELGALFIVNRQIPASMYAVPPPNAGMPYVGITFDKEHAKEIEAFAAKLKNRVK